jgi:hypothetical protein
VECGLGLLVMALIKSPRHRAAVNVAIIQGRVGFRGSVFQPCLARTVGSLDPTAPTRVLGNFNPILFLVWRHQLKAKNVNGENILFWPRKTCSANTWHKIFSVTDADRQQPTLEAGVRSSLFLSQLINASITDKDPSFLDFKRLAEAWPVGNAWWPAACS